MQLFLFLFFCHFQMLPKTEVRSSWYFVLPYSVSKALLQAQTRSNPSMERGVGHEV